MFLKIIIFQSESLSPCLYSICQETRHLRWLSVSVWDTFIDRSLSLSVPTLYGVPRVGRHQLLSLHLWISGQSACLFCELTMTFPLQICRFCWNKLRTEGNGLCPACRQPYTENPADFKPLTSEEMAKIKVETGLELDKTFYWREKFLLQAEKRQKDQAKKQKITENRKHLANVRVVQKNLVFVVGLSPRLADPEILKKPDYFGKFGKIHKVVINHSTQYAGSQMQVSFSFSSVWCWCW